MSPTEEMKILDVGAEINPTGERGLQLIDDYTWKKNVSAINLLSENISRIQKIYPEIDARVGDACALPWPDKYFDVVYCNAVIEHLGNFERQKKAAAEIMRVGKKWFVTTPNRWYPYEFHMRLLFVSWLPKNTCNWIGQVISYNHMQKKYVHGINRSDLKLMTAKELQLCFPASRIIKQRVTFMAETLICLGGLV